MKKIYIFGGGTVSHITSHFAVTAPAYGNCARAIANEWMKKDLESHNGQFSTETFLELTRMAGGDDILQPSPLETNEDIAARIEVLKKDPNTKVIFFTCALVDFRPREGIVNTKSQGGIEIQRFGKDHMRLETRDVEDVNIRFVPAKKIIGNIRKDRKDIFLVGFKTTCGATKQEMFTKGLRLCKESSVNLVLVNDVKTRMNMIVTPEEVTYCETENREEALKELVDMTYLRSQLTFTQSTVVAGNLVPWNDKRIPDSLRVILNHCIKSRAYKVFNGASVGHFAIKLSDTEFLTSIRKSDFNKIEETGLVYVKTDGLDTVLAYGAKPSVGGQSQRIVFHDHPEFDCITHFHCPLKDNHRDNIPIASQREYECGSHQCGVNTSNNLKQFGNLKCVMLDKHGPNIIYNKNIDPQEVINFIEANFDLEKKTGGYNV